MFEIEFTIIQTTEGREFVLAEIDDFEHEITSVRQHQELMEFLRRRSQETERYTLPQVREMLSPQ